jgi:hypothetical protein
MSSDPENLRQEIELKGMSVEELRCAAIRAAEPALLYIVELKRRGYKVNFYSYHVAGSLRPLATMFICKVKKESNL